MRISTAMLLLFPAITFPAAAQAPVSIPHAGESIEVSIVNVDTVVTDKQGRRVHGLPKDAFEIYENGVRQPITNFAEYQSDREATPAGPATSSAATAETHAIHPPAQPRTIIVFVERFQLASFRSDPLFEAMKKLLHQTVRSGDHVMVVTWNRGILGTLVDFTDDLARIDKAIDVVGRRSTTIMSDPMDDMAREVDALATWEAEQAQFGAGKDFGSAEILGESGLSFFVEENARMSAKNALLDEQRKVQTLNALMRATAAAEGKKVLLLATHRLSEYAGAEALFMAGANVLPSDFRRQFDGKPLIKSLVQTANANGFTIYPIYAEGLGSTAFAGADFKGTQPKSMAYDSMVLLNETPMLEYVAQQTGGVTAWGNKDVTNLLPRLVDDFESYYSLAYNASPGKAASRKIEVKVNDPKLTVRARKEFLPKSDTTKMEDRVVATLFGNAPPASFDVKVRLSAPKLDEKKHYMIPVAIEIPIGALTMLPGEAGLSSGAFSVYSAWGNTFGGVSDTHHETKQYSITAADLPKAKQSHFTYEFSVASATPYLRIALGVYDEVSKEYALNLIDLQPPPKRK
jgi:VWFA-related protein